MRGDYHEADVKGATAVIGVCNSVTKQYSIRIGINGGGKMPAAWELRSDEMLVQGPGHAEEGTSNSLGRMNTLCSVRCRETSASLSARSCGMSAE